jgi:16S rRNA processing protein RimM
MGRVAGPYGVRGWIKVAPERGGAQGLGAANEWWVGAEAYAVRAVKGHGAALVAQLAGIETREQAMALKGRPVSVLREALPAPEEGKYYHADLMGLRVVNERGEALGVVERIFSNGAQDVLQVAAEGKTRLLPWVAAVVKEVDLASREIRVEWGADW